MHAHTHKPINEDKYSDTTTDICSSTTSQFLHTLHAQLFKLSRSPFTTTHTPLLSHLYHPCSIHNSAPLQLTASHPHLPWVDGPPSLPSGASERRAKSPPNPQGFSSLSWNWAHRVAFILKSPCSIPIINDYPGLTTIRIDQNQGLKDRREQAGG